MRRAGFLGGGGGAPPGRRRDRGEGSIGESIPGPCWPWAPRGPGSASLLQISCWQVSLSWASVPCSSRGMRWGRRPGLGLSAGVGVPEAGVPPAPNSSRTAGGTDTARGSEMSRAVGEAGLVGPRGERAWGVALGGKAEAGAGGAGLAGGAGSPGVGLLQRKVRGSKSSPRSPSRQRGGLKSSSSPSSSHAEVRCEGEPESAPSPAAEEEDDSEALEEEDDSEEEDEDRLSQEPAGAGPTGKASLLEWGRRSLCSLWRPAPLACDDRDSSLLADLSVTVSGRLPEGCGGVRVPPSQGRGFFRGMLGPRPNAKKVFQLLPPGFRCFSPLSPFLLSTGEAEALGAVDSVGVPSRPWVRAWASSSVSRRVEGPLPARDLGLGRRQRPRARGPSDVLNPDWAGVRGRAGSLGGAGAGSSLGTSHLLPGGPLAPSAPRSYKG